MEKDELEQLLNNIGKKVENEDKLIEALKEKYGDLTDDNNPLLWDPSTREARGLSLEERVKYLELEGDMTRQGLASMIVAVSDLALKIDVVELRQKNPEAADLLVKMVEANAAGKNPLSGLMGSKHHIAPDQPINTVDGTIRADQIPGYKNEPGWEPSPDWAAINCACDMHAEMRRKNDSGPTGLYL